MDQLPTAKQLVGWLEEAHEVHAHIFGDNGHRTLSEDQCVFYRGWSDRVEAAIGRTNQVALLTSVTLAYDGAQRPARRLACRAICLFAHGVANRAETTFCDSLAADVGEADLGLARYDETQKGWSDQTKSLWSAMNAKSDWAVGVLGAADAMASQAEVAL